MSYTVVRQEGFQLPSPASSASPSNTPTSPQLPDHTNSPTSNNLFMPPFLPESFRKFPSAAQAHSQHQPTSPAAIDFTDDLATLIDSHPHHPSHERSTYDADPYRHNIFDISAPTSHYRPPSATDIYSNSQQHNNDLPVHAHPNFNSTLPTLNSSVRYDPEPPHFAYRHTPSPHNPNSRSRSRSRAPSLGPTRTSRRDRRTNSISSHVSGTSPPPPARPHAIIIPGRGGGSTMGGFFVPGQSEYSLPTSDSLSQSFGGFQAYNAPASYDQSASYASQNNIGVNYGSFGHNAGTPSMGISPTEVSALGMLASSPNTSAPVTTKSKHPDGDGLSEKRRRRRESHNAVERRRRDNINERIGELAGLIPGVLFECDAPLIPPTSPTVPNTTSPGESSDLFSLSLLSDSVMPEDGLPDVPENGVPTANGNTVKKDPSEDGDDARANGTNATGGVNGGIPTNGVTAANGSEPQMIKANKGMILRKSVEYIRYLQQLVSVQASRGRDLEERNRALERELSVIRGIPLPMPSPRSASSSNSDSSVESSRLSLSSSQTSLPQSSSSWESERKWEMDVEGRAEEERGRGRARARKEEVSGAKDLEDGVVSEVDGREDSCGEGDMEI